MPTNRVFARAALLLALPVSCSDGCSQGTGGDPRRFVSADAEVVVELSDLASLPSVREAIEARFEAAIPAADRQAAKEELARSLGFDPLTKEGLTAAGLAASGPVVGGIKDGTALWVVPVGHRGKFVTTVGRLVEARATTEQRSEKVDGVELTVFGRSFGDELAEVAAVAVRGGLGFVGVGSSAKAEVVAALGRQESASILGSEAYRRLASATGDAWWIRGVFPRGSEALAGVLRAAGRQAPIAADDAAVKGVEGASWALDLDGDGARVRGKVELKGAALTEAQALFRPSGPVVPGLRALDLPAAAAYVRVHGDAKALLERFAPPNSRTRRRLGRVLRDLGMASETEVVEDLTGQAALAVGVGDLSQVEFKQIVGNPMSVLWTAFALGVKAPDKFGVIPDEMKEQLEARGFTVSKRTVGKAELTSVVTTDNPEVVLVESAAMPGAVLYSNERAVTDAILGAGAVPEAVQAGLLVDLRLGQLARELRRFPSGRLPIMVRQVITRATDALTLLDRLALEVEAVDDGLRVDAALRFAAPAASP